MNWLSVDVEEKNSLDNSSEKSPPKSKCKLRIHCFPEIETAEIRKVQKENSINDKFTQNSPNLSDENKSQPWPKPDPQDSNLELERMLSQAIEQGYSNGFKDGQLEERKKIEKLAIAVSDSIANLEIFKAQIIDKAKESVIKLVSAISRKVVFKEPAIAKEVILQIAHNALQMVVDPANLKIKVNPEDLKLLNENKGTLETIVGKNAGVRIEPDETILTGGCIVETDFGDIDARIDVQLKIIEKALNDEFNLEMQRNKR